MANNTLSKLSLISWDIKDQQTVRKYSFPPKTTGEIGTPLLEFTAFFFFDSSLQPILITGLARAPFLFVFIHLFLFDLNSPLPFSSYTLDKLSTCLSFIFYLCVFVIHGVLTCMYFRLIFKIHTVHSHGLEYILLSWDSVWRH